MLGDAPDPPRIYPLTLQDGVLGGPGATQLLEQLPSSQFILIGEDHGYANPPELALAEAARRYGVVNHVAD